MDNERLINFIHGKLLELLKFTDGVCKAESIKYSLIGGTMLGAVRHCGFIPWDDDADIGMMRDDLNKFKAVVGEYTEGTDFKLCRNGRVDGVCYAEPQEIDGVKIGHICLDVFAIDNVPDDDKLFDKQVFGLKKLQGMMKKGKVDWKKYSFKGKILVLGTKILGAFKSEEKLVKQYAELSAKYNGTDSARRFISNDLFSLFDIKYDRELMAETEDMQFETERFPVFKGYDKILTLDYGDYMTPPPPEERRSSHTETSE
mgnify:CR=1 FL=1